MKNVEKKFGKNKALDNLSIRFENGIYGILGTNGAGKTTLLRCIVGIYDIEKGAIGFVDNQGEFCSPGVGTIGYLPQKFGIFKNMSVRDFMLYFAGMKEIEKEKRDKEIESCLKLVNLDDRMKTKIKKLSGGMIRRLGIAQALLGQPEILIFDEPTTGLDLEERMRFKKIISKIGRDRIVIISTHIVEDMEALCDKVIIMKNGVKIIEDTINNIVNSGKNHVYEVKEEQLKKMNSDYMVLKIYNKNGYPVNRIMSPEKLSFEEEPVTLEDIYFEYVSQKV
ncbi:MAG: ATP-binding cassette domain-containing protein [Lachnospiraceae bacterium]|nr:ATP-binding cassette domain-containing protein [Lachnospiraceae bacterium]